MISVFEQALLDTSVVIDYPAKAVAAHTVSAAVSTVTLAELAYGLHTSEALVNAAREQRYHWISNTFETIPFDRDAARTYGALCASVHAASFDPKPRRLACAWPGPCSSTPGQPRWSASR